jgi:hypothetical protein
MYGVDTGMTGLTPKPWDDNIVSTLKRYAPGVNSLECNTLDDCDVVFTDKICMDGGGMPYVSFDQFVHCFWYMSC